MSSIIPQEVFRAYENLGRIESIQDINMGLINKTYVINTSTQKYILQEISPIFDISIHYDSDAVSQYLIMQGLKAPRLLPTQTGSLFWQEQDRIFRALSYIAGHSYHSIKSLKMAKEAGFILGRFHQALLDFNYEYKNKRRHGGDYSFHTDNLIKALKTHSEHSYFSQVSALAEKMLTNMTKLTSGLVTTSRNAHGDPKISNIIFDEQDQAICLIDFDTLGLSGWSLEMGDALRSWCNPHQEDVLDAHVDLSIAEAAISGYGQAMKGLWSKKELEELSIHASSITLCLAMRYLADVLNESYWAYDQNKYQRPAEHNWLRAQAMYMLFEDFARHRPKMKELIECSLL